MIFCKGEFKSAYILLQGLKLFEKTSGLQANRGKSEVYHANMRKEEVDLLCTISGFSTGNWKFKYLGAPICNKKLTAADCEKLIEKMIGRIRTWQTRNLSFAGRLLLVNTILLSICTYWMQIVILPKSVISRINQICRNYLWQGNADGGKAGYVKWDKVCTTKKYGGLGIRDLSLWNALAVGKIIWQIAEKADTLWVRWVHSVYIKDTDWWTYQPPATASWIWKIMCKTRDELLNKDSSSWKPAPGKQLSISKAYKNMKKVGDKVYWDKVV